MEGGSEGTEQEVRRRVEGFCSHPFNPKQVRNTWAAELADLDGRLEGKERAVEDSIGVKISHFCVINSGAHWLLGAQQTGDVLRSYYHI